MIAKSGDGFLSESLDRTKYLASEMPQGFHFDVINTAYEKVLPWVLFPVYLGFMMINICECKINLVTPSEEMNL